MLGLEIPQKNLMIKQVYQTLAFIADADIQFEVLIGAGKVNQSSVHGNDFVNGLSYPLDCVRGAWGCWHPQTATKDQWIQLSFQHPKQFVGVVTQGRAHCDNWVKKFEVEYSSNGLQWIKVEPLMNALGAQLTYQKNSFYGNNDRNTKVTNYFKKPFSARTVRIRPIEFHSHPSLRFDFLTNKTT